MFISSLISIVALAADCPEGDASCEERPAPPLVILEPTKSPGAESGRDKPEEDEEVSPPLVILAPVPEPVEEPDLEEMGEEEECEDDEPRDDCVVVVTDRKPEAAPRSQLVGQYALQFLGDGPAHQIAMRAYTPKDTYLGAELRYLPGNEAILWSGRVGAGVDLLGASRFDLQLGLFLGSAGEWFVLDGGDALYHSPILGSEVRFAYEGHRFVTSYRLLGGFGVGPLQRFLSEREFILGYKVTDKLQVFGESVRIDPRSGDRQWSLGLGGRLVL